MRIQLQDSRLARILLHPLGKAFLGFSLALFLCGSVIFIYHYMRFAKLIDARLRGDIFARTSRIYASPEPLFVGQETSVQELTAKLRRAGYNENKTNRTGWYQQVPGGVEVLPGPDSYFQDEPAVVRITAGKIQQIISLKDNAAQQQYELEPPLITNLFDRSREKRRLVRFEDLPPDLVNAMLAAEDKSFFQHSGLDYGRIIKVVYEDIRAGNRAQGASTLTMQLSRGFFLTPERAGWPGIKRKLAEMMIALQLERRLTKQQIFEFYCNQIYMGQRGSFSINGMGEASLAYFGKEIRQLSLSESAFLVGIIRGPNIYSPHKYPDRARERRNRVLEAMHRIGAITAEQRDETVRTPVKVLPPYVETGDAPYFVDLVREQLLERIPEKALVSSGYHIYTTLDMNLQRAATEAVRAGILLVDEKLAKKKTKTPWPEAQAALVAVDAHTGEVKALVGGRFYGASQLNHTVAMRQPGSVFKPFVYAAAFNSALDGSRPIVTPVTVVDDSPTTFVYDGGTYQPGNYRENFRGMVPARYALAHSLNVATIKIGEMAGFEKIAKLARDAGLKTPKGTPSVALGSYESSPLEMAGAYTIFSNSGKRVDPILVRMVRHMDGRVIEENRPHEKPVLDPRVAHLMTRLMEGVINSGTGAGVRGMGFTAPAAGKTGTSHDGWFAGYTSNLLCIVWVGFDDNRELPLSGSQSALPIWTEFMKRAASSRKYRNMVAFPSPPGLTSAEIDPASNQLASAYCPERRPEIFIEGSIPTELCSLHTLQINAPMLPGNPFGIGIRPTVAQPGATSSGPAYNASPPAVTPAPRPNGNGPGDDGAGDRAAREVGISEPEKRKRGFFGKVFGVFKGGREESAAKRKKEEDKPQ